MPTKQLKTTIAAGSLVVAMACIALLFYSGARLNDGLSGPTRMTKSADGTLWVVSHRALHQLKADGMRVQKIELSELGIKDIVSGLAVAGNDTVFIAQASPSSIQRCLLQERKCTDITPAVTSTAGAPTYSMMIAVNDAAGRLLISDNGGHRVLLADFDGNVLDRSTPAAYRYPNQPTWIAADKIAVPDTNHHRIVSVSIADDKLGAPRRE